MPSPPAATPPRSRRRRRILAIVAALLLSPLVAEGAARLAGLEGLVLHEQRGNRFSKAEPPLPHRLRPGGATTVEYTRRNGDVVRTARMTVNELGFRGPLPAGGDPRIVCIGDSHTFGYGVDDGQPWPRRLEIELRLAGVESAEVLNFGVGGYEPQQELVRLRDDALGHAPDIVVWQWFVNDIQRRSEFDRSPSLSRRISHWTSPWQTGFVADLRRWSRLADHALHAVHVRFEHNASRLRGLAEEIEQRDGWTTSEAALREARRLAESRGARFVILVFPLLVADGRDFASADIDRFVIDFCERENIAYIDLAEFLPAERSAELRNSEIDYHPSAKCHALAGRAIADALIRGGHVAVGAGSR